MKTRPGFVSNSSSSSFLVALRKGYTLEQVVGMAGAFTAFAKALVDFVAKEAEPLESIENIALAYALKLEGGYGKDDEIVEWVKEGEWDWVTEECKKAVDNPEDWMFGFGWASYNETYDPVELFLGNGGKVDGEYFKVKGN